MSDLSRTKGEGVSQIDTRMGAVTDEADLDQMVQAASIPNLGALFRKGKEKGLLKPQQEYGHTT